MSVTPEDPAALPYHRRPPAYGGDGPDTVFVIDEVNLGPNLRYRPDPANPLKHGFVEPSSFITLDQFQRALAATRLQWRQHESGTSDDS